MDLRLKRIYEEPAPGDGNRVLIDRLWPRGVSKERAAVDVWLKEVAPSTELRKWFAHEAERWEEFERRYAAELAADPAPLERLRAMAEAGPLTLLYATSAPLHHGVMLERLLRSPE